MGHTEYQYKYEKEIHKEEGSLANTEVTSVTIPGDMRTNMYSP